MIVHDGAAPLAKSLINGGTLNGGRHSRTNKKKTHTKRQHLECNATLVDDLGEGLHVLTFLTFIYLLTLDSNEDIIELLSFKTKRKSNLIQKVINFVPKYKFEHFYCD